MAYPIILKYSDGKHNTTRLMKESELNRVLSEYPGMFLRRDMGLWIWQDEEKTMMITVGISDEKQEPIAVEDINEGSHMVDHVSLGYLFVFGAWERKTSERTMYETALKIAFYLREKMGLDVIDEATGEYLFPDKEGSLLQELRARAKRAPKRRKWLRRNEQAGSSSL